MNIAELQNIYASHPNAGALTKALVDHSVHSIFLAGMHASSASLFFSSFVQQSSSPFVFVLNDVEEAGYFYHDLVQVNGEEKVLFFPSSYRRAIKYGQKDAANEILRTEVLSALQKDPSISIVTYPDALAERVVSGQALDEYTLKLTVGQQQVIDDLEKELLSHGFEHVDYVYEPGQFAVRGSIVDVFSFASEYPYRIDFFGDEIDSIRTFAVVQKPSLEDALTADAEARRAAQ